jgi:hypothetical protein
MRNPAMTQEPLALLVALALFGLMVLSILAWWTVRVAEDRNRARRAFPLLLFGVAAISGVLWFAEGAGISQLTVDPGDRAGLAWSALFFGLAGAAVARAQARRGHRRKGGHGTQGHSDGREAPL